MQAWSKAARAYHDRIGVQATANAPVAASDVSRCLHVSEAMERRGEADLIVTMIAFILVCASISADRKQQLLNQHLRQMLLPPPWRSLRSAAFKLIECILAALLPTVCLSMILLLFGSASLTATDVLLNGVAVAFVLLVDDELPAAILSDVDRKAIDEFAEGVGDVPLMMASAQTLVLFPRIFPRRPLTIEPMSCASPTPACDSQQEGQRARGHLLRVATPHVHLVRPREATTACAPSRPTTISPQLPSMRLPLATHLASQGAAQHLRQSGARSAGCLLPHPHHWQDRRRDRRRTLHPRAEPPHSGRRRAADLAPGMRMLSQGGRHCGGRRRGCELGRHPDRTCAATVAALHHGYIDSVP